jgi:hypothetical protein
MYDQHFAARKLGDQPAAQTAAALQAAFPGYLVSVRIRPGETARFELVARDNRNPWCLISPDPDEIRAELNGAE